MSGLLLDEQFVAVFPSLVKRLGGMNEAAVLQTVHFASRLSEVHHENFVWVELTSTAISRQTGLSSDQVFRALSTLREQGVLIAKTSPKGGRKLIWRIDMDILEGIPRNRGIDTAKSRNAFRESATSTTYKEDKEESKNNTLFPEAKILPIRPSEPPSGSTVVIAFVEEFKAAHSREPDSGSVGRIGQTAKRLLKTGSTVDDLVEAAKLCARAGHANLSASLLKHIAKPTEPKGFKGIREFLDDEE
jgi:hypothetical protein